MNRIRGEKFRAGRGDARGRAVLLAVLAWMGLSLDLNSPDRGQIVLNLIASFQGFSLSRLILLPGLYFLFRRASGVRKGTGAWLRLLPACFFAANLVLGYAFAETGGWDMLRGIRDGQTLKALAVFAAWSVTLYAALTMLFALLDQARVTENAASPAENAPIRGFHPLRRYARLLRKAPFRTAFLTLLVCYLLRFVAAYPAMFMGDTWSMIVQGYSELGMTGVDYLSPENVLRAGVMINQHHPVFYTLVLHGFLRLGEVLFHSLNKGIFLFCLGQAALITAAFAYAVSVLAARRVRARNLGLLILYFAIHPQIRNFLFLITKDGLYTASFLVLTAAFFRKRTDGGRRRDTALLCLSALGILLLRNEGKYVLLLSGLLMALTDRQNRKAILCFTAAATVLALGISQGLYPALGYTKGGTQEALSVPFQQTARVLREHPEEIIGEERAAIDGVLEYNRMAAAYNPDTADAVKDLYRQEADGQTLLTYFRAWLRLLRRFPDTCLQATYGNYYEYLYPGEVRMSYYEYGWSAWMCDFANRKITGLGRQFRLPAWNEKLRYISDSLVDAGLFNVPPFSLLMTPALYSWGLIALFCWCLGGRGRKPRRVPLTLLIPSLVTFLVMFAGPTNGYYSRYMLTLTAALPVLLLMALDIRGARVSLKQTESGR
ncbi:MAG: hypothetical protein IJ231_02435 [Clostridia bacterium]|nr:hypothetical protein [Clostridia bacterium]